MKLYSAEKTLDFQLPVASASLLKRGISDDTIEFEVSCLHRATILECSWVQTS